MAEVVTRKRCAVYARVSTDERLDQEFNSIDAQREAGRAFIASQRHEGWLPVADDYEDGGFSGGSMERPALKRLLLDIEDRRIVVVVYKIDRLTRSLPAADIDKLVMDQVRAALDAPEIVLTVLKEVRKTHPRLDEARVCIALKRLHGIWDQLYPAEQNRLLRLLVERVQLRSGGLEITWRELGIYEVAAEIAEQPLVTEARAVEEARA